MIGALIIKRGAGKGRYGDVLDACETLSEKYGTAANAAAQLIRSSEEFKALVEAGPKKLRRKSRG